MIVVAVVVDCHYHIQTRVLEFQSYQIEKVVAAFAVVESVLAFAVDIDLAPGSVGLARIRLEIHMGSESWSKIRLPWFHYQLVLPFVFSIQVSNRLIQAGPNRELVVLAELVVLLAGLALPVESPAGLAVLLAELALGVKARRAALLVYSDRSAIIAFLAAACTRAGACKLPLLQAPPGPPASVCLVASPFQSLAACLVRPAELALPACFVVVDKSRQDWIKTNNNY